MSKLLFSLSVPQEVRRVPLPGADCVFDGFAVYDDKTVGYKDAIPSCEWYYRDFYTVTLTPASLDRTSAQIHFQKELKPTDPLTLGTLSYFNSLTCRSSILINGGKEETELANAVAQYLYENIRAAFAAANEKRI